MESDPERGESGPGKRALIACALAIPVVAGVLVFAASRGYFEPRAGVVERTFQGGAVVYTPPPANEDIRGDLGNGVNDLIRVSNPMPGAKVKSPLVVEGEARGPWYFEGVFPVYLIDTHGLRMGATVQAHAIGEWTTSDFVPFRATITYSAPVTGEGMIVLMKDNPSGLPENNAAFQVPVKF